MTDGTTEFRVNKIIQMNLGITNMYRSKAKMMPKIKCDIDIAESVRNWFVLKNNLLE